MVSQIFKSYIDKHKLKHKLSKMLQDINYTTRVAQKKKKTTLLGRMPTPTPTLIDHPSLNLLKNCVQTQLSLTPLLHLITVYDTFDMVSDAP